MPTQTVWIDPELFLEHQEVRVFHTYKDDDFDQGAQRYDFTVNPQCGEADSLCHDQPCQHVFNVRELSTWQPSKQPPYCTGVHDTPENHAAWDRYWEQEQAGMKTAIIAAIDRGELSGRGWQQRQPDKSTALAPSQGA